MEDEQGDDLSRAGQDGGLHVVAPEERARRRARRIARGRADAMAREHQMLPFTLGTLSVIDRDLLNSSLLALSRNPRAPAGRIAAALALQIMLETGRGIELVSDLSVHTAFSPGFRGLVCSGHGAGWVLEPGRPASQQKVGEDLEDHVEETSSAMWLPASSLVLTLARRVIERRGDPWPPVQEPWKLFTTSPERLRSEVGKLLERLKRHTGAQLSTKRVSTSFRDRLHGLPGGDAATAALATATHWPLAGVVSHYTSVSQKAVQAAALALMDESRLEPIAVEPPEPLKKVRFGSRYLARPESLQRLRENLVNGFADGHDDTLEGVAAFHKALMLYTMCMSAFASGFRHIAHVLPAPQAIDPDTGFLIIRDKDVAGEIRARLVWVPPAIRTQLELFDAHSHRLEAWAASQNVANVERPRASLGYMPRRSQAVRLLKKKRGRGWTFYMPTAREVFGILHEEFEGSIRVNAGRHFLRSHLIGQVSEETLRAFLGHWQQGQAPWKTNSALDPLLYREELQATLPDLLARNGWVPRSGMDQSR